MDSDRPPDDSSPSASPITVATLANDLRNLLTMMVTSLDSLRSITASNQDSEPLLAELDRAVAGGFRVSQDMVTMVRPPRPESVVVDLNMVVNRALPVIERLVGAHVAVRVNLTPFSAVVRASSLDVEWLLLNLASNAADTMSEGGLLIIETDLIRIPSYVTSGLGPAGLSHGRLTVTDTGGGMNAFVRARAIEPFFSTKSGAFGLGLTSAALIVRRLGGYFRIATTGPEGTSLEVYLPAAEPRDKTR